MDAKEAMREYEEHMLEIRRLEKRCEELKPIILPVIPEDENVVSEKGYFYIQKRATWKFPANVELLEKDLKKAKADAKAKGDASAEYQSVLYFKEGEPKDYSKDE